jgi:2-oxoglutarate dehydrogenase E2 component (dihydrolipoamide succinyltransferase)
MPYGLLLTEDWPEFTQDADRRALEPHAPAGDLPAPMAAPEAPAEPAAAAPAPAEPPADAGWFEPPQPPPAEGEPPR